MRLIAILILIFASLPLTARAQDPTLDLDAFVRSLPGERKDVVARLATRDYALYSETATSSVVPAPEVGGGEALRVAVPEAGPDSWSTQVQAAVSGDIAEGDVVMVAFLARTVEASNEAQNGVIAPFAVQLGGPPYNSVVTTSALVPLGEWRLFHGWARSPLPLTAETGAISVHLSATAQVIDLGPSVVVNLGAEVDTAALPREAVSYAGRETDAAWRRAALERIEQHRVSPLTVEVRDADGAPVEGASVRVWQRRSAFGFGTFVGGDIVGFPGEDGERYRQAIERNFSYATTPIYWADYGWANPGFREDYVASMAWLAERGIPFRAHPIIYPNEPNTPSAVRALEPGAETLGAVLDHVRDVTTVARAYGVEAYDAYNEARDDAYLRGRAGDDVPIEVFRTAHQIDPDAVLYMNDYGMLSGGGMNEANLSTYEAMIRDFRDRGAPVGGIGFQGHFGGTLTDPARLVAVLERFSAFGLPLQITEFDIDTADEAVQADYLRDAMIAAYSVPSVDAFVMWGFWAGDHWKPQAALIREDWSPKPAWAVWQQMQRRWRTNERTSTNADGTATIRGHHGEHRVWVTAPDGTRWTGITELAPGGTTMTVSLRR